MNRPEIQLQNAAGVCRLKQTCATCLNLVAVMVVAVLVAPQMAAAQMVNISTPFVTTNDSFFERNGVNFGFDIPGGGNLVGLGPDGNPTPNGAIQFRQGGFGSAIPAFGGNDPAANANFGFANTGGPINTFFNFAAGQGSSRSIVSQTPSVTIMNGQQGTIIDATQTTFVTGLIPVVGGGFMPVGMPAGVPGYSAPAARPTSLLRQRLNEYQQQLQNGGVAAPGNNGLPAGGQLANPARQAARQIASPQERAAQRISSAPASTANHGDLSVAEIKRNRSLNQAAKAHAAQQQVDALVARAEGAQAAGKYGAAKIYYRQALQRASGQQQRDIRETIRTLSN